jgi:glycosyltransferase involved in cell wall biosynthesis
VLQSPPVPADPLRLPGPILLNGRAATRPTITGVERFTTEVLPRLKALDPERYRIVAPPPAAQERTRAQAWEQIALPALAAQLRAALVYSPANLAPVLWPRNVLVMHDAAPLREPAAYSAAYRIWHGRLGLAAARRARSLITVSEFSRRELAELTGWSADALAVIPPGVSEHFTPLADPEPVRRRLGLQRPYVLTVATADQRKNLGALGEAARLLGERGIELCLAGDRRPYFTAGGHPSPLRHLGYVAEPDLPAVYGGALAFVLPSRYEGFGLTCLEAMASGTPVVAARRAALPETCGDAALLVDPDDRRSLAEAVMAAATDDPTRSQLRSAGLSHAAEFTWGKTAALTHELLVREAGRVSPGSGPRPGTRTGPRPGTHRGAAG